MTDKLMFKERLFLVHNPLNTEVAYPLGLSYHQLLYRIFPQIVRTLSALFSQQFSLSLYEKKETTVHESTDSHTCLDFSIGSSININKHTHRASVERHAISRWVFLFFEGAKYEV